ncbi:MAG: HlyC/CorC family transporter [Bacteroidetes bacterium]|nr:MAG: HlyC/CorC family transporter [Bacteroidota bacterium]
METENIYIIISLLFSALFSATELAFISANRLHIELQRQKGKLSGVIFSNFSQKPSYFITSMLIGNTVSLVIYGIFMAKILDIPIIQFIQTHIVIQNETTLSIVAMVVQSLVSTLLVLVVAEFLPKSLSLINPEKLLDFFALPIQIIYKILYPCVYVVVNTSKFLITHVFRAEYKEPKPTFGLNELNHYISNISHEESTNDVDAKIFANAVEFKGLKVRDCMVPRKEMIAVDKNDGITNLINTFVESGFSKIIVFNGSIDNIMGYCHSIDLFKKPVDIESILSPLLIIPETKSANELMIDFISERKSIALVVDEFGGTSGLVTIEDVMEEIFGEINDEFDEENNDVKQLDNKNFIVSARLEVDFLNEKYSWEIPEGDYDTLGGYIISETKNIPQVDDVVHTQRFMFKVISKQDVRLDFVQVTLKKLEEM